ncbi:MAG: hypothetical protein R3324_09400 [Halobacteriales archaeon]|nr:hypothetical protein [Halobacteriales archaeon]
MTLIITNEEVEQLVTMTDCVEAMDEAQRAYGEGKAVHGPVCRVMTPRDPSVFAERGTPQATGEAKRSIDSDYPLHYTYTSLSGAIEPLGVTCDRIDSDGIYYVEDADGIKEVRVPMCRDSQFCGLITLWDSDTAEPLAYIHDAVAQKMRVAACSAIGSKYLARADASEMALIGTGWQASTQIQAHPVVRDLETVRVYSQTPDHRREFVEYWNDRLDLDVVETDSIGSAVDGADIVVTATNSVTPLITREMVEHGMFLTGVKHLEFEVDVYHDADRIFANSPTHRTWERFVIGGSDVIPEERFDDERRAILEGDYPLLGEAAAGVVEGRRTEGEVINLINKGDGIQFAAVGHAVYRRAVEAGVGHEIPTELFLQGKEYVP